MKSYIPTAIALACVFALVLAYFCIQMDSARDTVRRHEHANTAKNESTSSGQAHAHD